MKFSVFLLAILNNFPTFTVGWHLAQVGLNESYRVLHLSTYYTRVFLSIAVESQQFPTLIESRWPETFMPMPTIIYPHASLHAKGDHRDCSHLQQALWSQVDSLSRLWVMDVGWRGDDGAMCSPKLFVFDLIRNNMEVLRIDCSKYIEAGDASKLLAVKLGPHPSLCGIEKYIYFIRANDPHILAYDILEQTWQKRKLLARKYDSISESLPIQPLDMTFGREENELLISDVDGVLYSSMNALLLLTPVISDNITSNAINRSYVDEELEPYIELKMLGTLLGPSKGMMIDDDLGVLFYVVPKFGAIVRCEPLSNLTAEGNEIIYMTSRNVQQIFFGSHGAVWLLSDRWLGPHDHCFPS